MLDSDGGVTAVLKRAIELQPLAENRARGIAIDGWGTWRSARLLEADFVRS